MNKIVINIAKIASINLLLATLLVGVASFQVVKAQSPELGWITYYHNAPLMSDEPYGILNQLLDV